MARFRKRVDKTAVTLIAGLSVVAVLAVGFVIWLGFGKDIYTGVNINTFCREEGHRSVTVVLIDATDPFTPEQKERLIGELKRLRDNIPRFDRIVLYAIDSSNPEGAGQPLVSACNPGQASDADAFRENAR